MKCRDCGRKFNFDDAADEFNSYFNGAFDYSMNGWEGYCASCAIDSQKMIRYDDDDIPVGCNTCGGDYPNCKSSCPMFD